MSSQLTVIGVPDSSNTSGTARFPRRTGVHRSKQVGGSSMVARPTTWRAPFTRSKVNVARILVVRMGSLIAHLPDREHLEPPARVRARGQRARLVTRRRWTSVQPIGLQAQAAAGPRSPRARLDVGAARPREREREVLAVGVRERAEAASRLE